MGGEVVGWGQQRVLDALALELVAFVSAQTQTQILWKSTKPSQPQSHLSLAQSLLLPFLHTPSGFLSPLHSPAP